MKITNSLIVNLYVFQVSIVWKTGVRIQRLKKKCLFSWSEEQSKPLSLICVPGEKTTWSFLTGSRDQTKALKSYLTGTENQPNSPVNLTGTENQPNSLDLIWLERRTSQTLLNWIEGPDQSPQIRLVTSSYQSTSTLLLKN